METTLPNGALPAQADRHRICVNTSRVRGTTSPTSAVSRRQEQKRYHGRTRQRDRGWSNIRVHANVPPAAIPQEPTKTRERPVLRVGTLHRSKRQGTGSMEHERPQRSRRGAPLQEPSSKTDRGGDRKKRLLYLDRLQEILSLPRTRRRVQELCSRLDRKEQVDTRKVQDSGTSHLKGKHSCIRGKRRAKDYGKTAEATRQLNPRKRKSERQNNGRHCHDVFFDKRPHSKRRATNIDRPRSRTLSLLEEVNYLPETSSTIFRSDMVISTESSVCSQTKSAGNPNELQDRTTTNKHFPPYDRPHHRSTSSSQRSSLPCPNLDTIAPTMGERSSPNKGMGPRDEPRKAPKGSSDSMDLEHSRVQRNGDSTDPAIRHPSRRRSRIRIRRNSPSVTGSNPRLLGSEGRKIDVVQPQGTQSRRENSDALPRTPRHSRLGDSDTERQFDVQLLHQQARGQSADARQHHQEVCRTLPAEEERDSSCIPHTRARHSRNGSRRILAWQESAISPQPRSTGETESRPSGPQNSIPAIRRHTESPRRNIADTRKDFTSDTDLHVTSMVATSPEHHNMPPDRDPQEPTQSDSGRIRESTHEEIFSTTRFSSLECLRRTSRNQYLSAEFVQQQLSSSRQDKGKVYDRPWARWVEFSKNDQTNPEQTSLNPEWHISILKFTAFLKAIRDGFAGVKPNVPSYIKSHSTAVLLTLELAGAINQRILRGVQEVRQTRIHQSVWKDIERDRATSNARGVRSQVATTVLPEDKCWDPGQLLEFWHNFPSLAAMKKANWPAPLIYKLIRAKAVAIVRIELAARSVDVTTLSWSRISPRFPICRQSNERRQIAIQLYNTKQDKLRKNYGKLSPPKYLFETKGSNACVVQTLNELYETTPFHKVEVRDDSDPIFVSERISKNADGKTCLKGLSSERLSNIARLSYIGAQIKSLLPRHIRNMASSKVDIVGIPEKTFLAHCQWTTIATFKKFYKRTFNKDLPSASEPTFSDALHAGMTFPTPETQCVVMRANVLRLLAASSKQVSPSAKSSDRTLRKQFKITDKQIDSAIQFDTGLIFPQRRSTRLRKKYEQRSAGGGTDQDSQ